MVRPAVADSSKSTDPIIPDAPPSSPGSPPSPMSSRRPVSPPPLLQHPHLEDNMAWRNVDLSAWDFPENPFKHVHDKLEEFQTQYYRLEHITKGASLALGGCGPGNIL